MRRISVIIVITTIMIMALLAGGVIAAEKPVNIKGVYIDMPIDEARTIISNALGGDWKVTDIGPISSILADYRFGNESVFGKKRIGAGHAIASIIGDYGFSIHRYDSHEGFISADEKTKKVTRISLGGEITEALYKPEQKQKLDMEEFVKQFTQNFDLPEFNWIPFGWAYESPNGYIITLKTNKLIDIEKSEGVMKKSSTAPPEKDKIKF